MKKQLLTSLLFLLASITTVAQTWYDVDNGVTDLTFTSTCDGCSVSTVANPDATDTEATNVLLWKIAADTTLDTAGLTDDEIAALKIGNKDLSFSFPNGYVLTPADFASLSVNVRLYMPDITNYSNFDSLTRIRFYLGTQQVQVKLSDLEGTDVNGWYTLTFDFSGKTYTENVTSGYIRILGQSNRFTNLNNDIDFHFDTFTSSVALSLDQGAVLDAEAVLDAGNAWYHNYSPDTFGVTVNEVQGGVFLEQGDAVTTPTTTGNSSPLVAKFTKGEDPHSQIKFQLPGVIDTDYQSGAIFKIRAYVPSTNVDGTSGRRLRMYLRNGTDNAGQKNITIDVTVFDAWQEYTFDFTEVNLTEGVSYSTANLLIDQPDADLLATGNVYYFDAFQGPAAAILSVDNFELSNASIVAYPNPATNSFQIDSSLDIENVKLYNINGRLVKTFKANTNYDVSNLAKGIYIVDIKTLKGLKTLKIVKE
ncbi:Por secretion system C-terminal sorting domain-containing protein [Polaribacter sp. KT25b]|uniref:T9SS type A sorting domain-containing protein n=1 Tax=Polaribacter sp. KT25b TaxID=1855336 RepID=UPI00087AE953|nr:T9SS type A sorting domain-containing protein [Polaribacter sp. KT25b]SDS22873.1 Por secretion system C-terminal sorting domain-containing protein [Polaribacter sp. KT25b]